MAKVGRPRKYTSNDEVARVIDDYFADCDKYEKPYTICGLAFAMGIDRVTLLSMGKDEKFFSTIKAAKAKCERYAEEHLFVGKNVAGVIFNLKNNYGWKDQQHVETDTTLNIVRKTYGDD